MMKSLNLLQAKNPRFLILKDQCWYVNCLARKFSNTKGLAADEAGEVEKGLDLEQEQKRLTEDHKVAMGHYDALRKLEKGKKLTQQEQENISKDKETYAVFFDTDSEGEVTGKAVS